MLTAAAIAAALLVAALGPIDATGHNKLFKSRVKVSFHVNRLDSIEIHGVVKSREFRCKADRKVKVFAVRPGRDPKVGQTKTNKKGQWWLTTSLAITSDQYKAKIGRVKKVDRHKNHGCTSDVGFEGVT